MNPRVERRESFLWGESAGSKLKGSLPIRLPPLVRLSRTRSSIKWYPLSAVEPQTRIWIGRGTKYLICWTRLVDDSLFNCVFLGFFDKAQEV